MDDIKRLQMNERMSQAVIHNGTVYLAGQLGTAGASVEQQTQDILANIDELLAAAGTDKTRILQAVIWLASMEDFDRMNSIWDAWVPQGHTPARLCGSADLAPPDYTVEIAVIAALPCRFRTRCGARGGIPLSPPAVSASRHRASGGTLSLAKAAVVIFRPFRCFSIATRPA